MKKLLALLCAVMMLASLVCVASAEEERITVKMVNYDIDERITTALGTGETKEDNRYLWKLAEMGIDVEYLWITTSNQYSEKLGMSLSSGDLPDIIPFTSLDQLHQAYEAGYLTDLSGMFDEYASDLLKEIYSYDNNAGQNAATFDGFVAALTGIKPAYDANPMLFIRKDWLDNLGLEDPQSHEDLLNIIAAFTENDPDGNGVNDTYGLAMGNSFDNSYAFLTGFCCAYDSFPTCWYVNDEGKTVYGAVQSTTKTALSALRDLYAKGYIDPEFYTKNADQVMEDITAGKVGVVYSVSWYPWISISSFNMDGADWCCYPLTYVDGGIAPTPIKTDIEAYYGVRAGYEHPEVLFEIMNSYVECIWGENADAAYWFGSGDTEGLWHFSPVACLHPYNNFKIMEGIQQLMDNGGNTEGVYGVAVPFYEGVKAYREGDKSLWAYEKVMSENQYSTNAVNQVNLEAGVAFDSLRAWTQASSDYGDVLDQIINGGFTKIITGEAELDTFETIVEDWYKNGGTQYTEEMQAWYDATL